MDPLSTVFGTLGIGGAVLFVIWKLVMRVIAAWERVTSKRMELEEKRVEQQLIFSTGIVNLADKVGDNTEATLKLAEESRVNSRLIKRLIRAQTPGSGVRAIGR